MMEEVNGPNYRDLRQSDGTRAVIAPHLRMLNGQPAHCWPSCEVIIGSYRDDRGEERPSLTVLMVGQPFALVFLPTAEELEAMAETCATSAARMRQAAEEAATAALNKAMGK